MVRRIPFRSFSRIGIAEHEGGGTVPDFIGEINGRRESLPPCGSSRCGETHRPIFRACVLRTIETWSERSNTIDESMPNP
jgi:hypothetical protein